VQFRNRNHAADLLATALAKWRGSKPLILAIPRGAVPMGRIIAQALDGELDVVLTRKLPAPGNPELAIGAVGESGWYFLDTRAAVLGVSDAYIQSTLQAQRTLMAERRARYTPRRSALVVADRVVIVVDDGLATGATMIAALHDIKALTPKRLICAAPVASSGALDRVRALADEVVCLSVPREFWAVGQFYQDFPQVEDDEVIAILQSTGTHRTAK
jgi:putative phosphoribosyl transferase